MNLGIAGLATTVLVSGGLSLTGLALAAGTAFPLFKPTTTGLVGRPDFRQDSVELRGPAGSPLRRDRAESSCACRRYRAHTPAAL
jgi:hypothetical protein